jgi:hypothetical protein
MADDDDQDWASVVRANTRPWQSFWYWRDKPIGEIGAARLVLTASGLKVGEDLRSRSPDDPPDCEGTVDDQWCGIEVTELVHEGILKRALRAIRERLAGKIPEKPEGHFVWNKDTLAAKLKEIIHEKERQAKSMKGGPYSRYILVIVTAEMFLYRDAVEAFLRGTSFQASLITDAFLGLDYHPDANARSGSYPAFRLQLIRR